MTDESWDLTATAVVSPYSAFYLEEKKTAQLIINSGLRVSGSMRQVLLSRLKLHLFTGGFGKTGRFELAIRNIRCC